jgi:hypothetical protein
VKCANQTYCGEVTTTVVNEVDDLMASKGHPVELLASGKDIDVTLQNGRRIKAHQVAAKKCMQNSAGQLGKYMLSRLVRLCLDVSHCTLA